MLNVAVENTPYPPVLIVWKTHSLYSSMFGFIIVTDKIAGAVIELGCNWRVQLLMGLVVFYILSPIEGSRSVGTLNPWQYLFFSITK